MRRHAAALAVSVFVAAFSPASLAEWKLDSPEGAGVTTVVAHPTEAGRLWAATWGGIYRTVDAGASWTPSNQGLSHSGMNALAMDPKNPAVLYAGDQNGRVFRSQSSGDQWAELSRPTAFQIRGIVVDDNLLYVVTGEGLFKSADSGISWQRTRLDLIAPNIAFLFLAPNGTLYAGLFEGLGVYSSTDDAESWTRVTSLPLFHYRAMAADSSGTLYLGAHALLRSTDRGQSWTTFLRPGSAGPDIISILPVGGAGNDVYVATNSGLFRFSPASSGWSKVLEFGHALVKDPGPSSRIYAGSHLGMHRSEGDSSFIPINRGLSSLVLSIAATDFSIFATTPNALFRTQDPSGEWDNLAPGDSSARVTVDPASNAVFASGYSSVSRSRDDGESWEVIRPGRGATAIAISPSNPSTIYAGFVDTMAKSEDGGDSWRAIENGLPGSGFYYYYSAEEIAVDPLDDSTAWTANYYGLFMTDNGGENWVKVPAVIALAIEILPDESSSVMVGTRNGVARSVDGGMTFFLAGLQGETVPALAFDPKTAVLFAGTESGQVYRSLDFGESWTVLGDGLGGGAVNDLDFDDTRNELHAATNSGAYHFSFDPPPPFSFALLPGNPARLEALLDSVQTSSSALLIPAAANTRGAFGTYFRSDVTLVNGRSAPQEVVVFWLAQGREGFDAPAFRFTIPASDGAFTTTDFVGELGLTGVGALLFTAIDANGNLDPSALLDGFSRTWTPLRDSPGTSSQAIPAVNVLGLRNQNRLNTIGLRHDENFRTNVGLVNLGTHARTFTIEVIGERGRTTLSVTVPPLSMVQSPLPSTNFGAVSLNVTSAAGETEPWLFYGSSVDNRSGAGWTQLGRASPF